MQTVPTLATYATCWLPTVAATRKATTARRYGQIVRTYLTGGAFGERPLCEVTRAHCRELLVGLLARGHAPATARAVLAVLQALLSSAQVDDLIAQNPAYGLRRAAGLVPQRTAVAETVRALTAPELARFLARAWRHYPQLAPVLEACARGALRLGEALALRAEDRGPGELRLRRTYSDRLLLTPPKGGLRTVEIGVALETVLDHVGQPTGWLFPSRRPGPGLPLWDATWIGRVTQEVARRASLPRVHPHMLRHTAASLWLATGEPVEWVSRQLGHGSTAFTERVYGRWLRTRNPAGLRRYDALLAGRRGEPFPLDPGERVNGR